VKGQEVKKTTLQMMALFLSMVLKNHLKNL